MAVNQKHRRRNYKLLWGLLILAFGFSILLHFRPGLTSSSEINGILGVSLGLFISSWPAANFLDMLLLEHRSLFQLSLTRFECAWLGMNALVLLTGLVTVMTGTKLFFKNWV